MASILIGRRLYAVGTMPDLFVTVVASWMLLAADTSLVDTAVLGALDEQDEIDVPAFAAFFASEYQHRHSAPWALPAGVCVVDGARAHVVCPKRLIDATWETAVAS